MVNRFIIKSSIFFARRKTDYGLFSSSIYFVILICYDTNVHMLIHMDIPTNIANQETRKRAIESGAIAFFLPIFHSYSNNAIILMSKKD